MRIEIRPALKYIGGGDIHVPPKKSSKKPKWGFSDDYSLSKRYQWLPSEFKVNENGSVEILSYINNLHPVHHKEIYPLIAKIFEQFVPMFERVLTDLLNPRGNRIEVDGSWYADDDVPSDLDDEAADAYYENRPVIQPKVPKFEPPPPPQTVVKLSGKTLQVIVKLANIELTPDKPNYPGGTWHVEGMKNEYIVSSGIYYYVSENITESRLAFRQSVCEPPYEQGDNRGVGEIFGLANDQALVQGLGSVITQGDRCIAFPNVYQHQVSPFQLIDPTKPGHRKILVFFLVDPAELVISTLHVPPQQISWYAEEISRIFPFSQLPKHVFETIVSFLEWPMSLEEAKQHRGELMKERKFFVEENTEKVFERPFSLCEH